MSYKSFAVNFILSAASLNLLESFHSMLLYPSGDNIEYIAFSNIITLFATPIAKAPPDEPSPITIAITGTVSFAISNIDFAIASPCPLCSASTPG